jgi:putative endopeptidase
MNILSLVQSGLTLGEKEYYLENDEATTEIRNAFKKHIAKMFQLYGFSEAQAQENANLIMRYETTLALVSKNNTELRDVEANYNKMTIKEFEANYPHIGLTKQLKAEGIADNCFAELVVGQPDFFAGVDKLIATQSAAELKAYIEWNVICSSASYLSNDIVSANFDFYGKTMSGRTEMLPLWKRATSQVDGVLGESLGKMYCKKYFPAKSKARMEQLVKNLQASLAERIKAQDWMSEATKAAALDKLAAFYVKIGYPNKWKDVSALTIDPKKSYYDNILECRKFWNKFFMLIALSLSLLAISSLTVHPLSAAIRFTMS